MNRTDKYINLGFRWLHYIHYKPNKWSSPHWGFQTTTFKDPSIDFYFGRHVFVFTIRPKW